MSTRSKSNKPVNTIAVPNKRVENAWILLAKGSIELYIYTFVSILGVWVYTTPRQDKTPTYSLQSYIMQWIETWKIGTNLYLFAFFTITCYFLLQILYQKIATSVLLLYHIQLVEDQLSTVQMMPIKKCLKLLPSMNLTGHGLSATQLNPMEVFKCVLRSTQYFQVSSLVQF